MPDLFGNIRTRLCSSFETQIPDHDGSTIHSRFALSEMPRGIGIRAEGSDVRDGNETKRIASRMFLMMLDHDLGTDLRDWYEAGWFYYETLIKPINGESR